MQNNEQTIEDWYKALAGEEAELAATVRRRDDRVWEVDSPRKALAWLRLQVELRLTQIQKIEKDGQAAIGMPARAFYRGQKNKTWKPRPSLLREQGLQRVEEDRAARIMAAVVDSTFAMLWDADGAQAWPPLLKSAGYAAAQHYGLKTTLLDWTVNPQTAVHFGTSEKVPVKDEPPGAVFWIDAAIAEQFGLKIVLAPPFVRRLYMQRGFFTDLREDQVEELDLACSRIEFPNYPKEQVVAIGEDRAFFEVDILPKDGWFETLAQWSRDKAKTVNTDQFDGVRLSIEFAAKYGEHPELGAIADMSLFLSGELFEMAKDYINQLTLLFCKGGKKCHSPRMMEFLRKNNPEFFVWAKEQKIVFPECDEAFFSSYSNSRKRAQ